MSSNSPNPWSPLKVAIAACAGILMLGAAWYSTSKVVSGIGQLFSDEDDAEQATADVLVLFAEVERIAAIDDVDGARKLVQDHPKNEMLHWQLTSQLISKQCWNSLVAILDSLILDEPHTPAKILSEVIKKGCSVEVAKQIGGKGFKLNASQVIELLQHESYEPHVLALLVAGCVNTNGLEQYPGRITKIFADIRSYREQIQAIPEIQRADIANVLARLALRADAEQWTWLLDYCGAQQRKDILWVVVQNADFKAVHQIFSTYNIDISSFTPVEQGRIREYIKLDSLSKVSTQTSSSTEIGAYHQLEYLAVDGYSASQFDEIFDKFPQVMGTDLPEKEISLVQLLFQNEKYFAVRSLEKRGAKLDTSWTQDANYRFFCACNEDAHSLPTLFEDLGGNARRVVSHKYHWGRGSDWHLTPLQFAVRTSNVRLFQSLCEVHRSSTPFAESILKLIETCPPSQDDTIRKSLLAMIPNYHRAEDESLQRLIAAVRPQGLSSLKRIQKRTDLPFGLHELPELFDLVCASKEQELFEWYISLVGQDDSYPGKRTITLELEKGLFNKVLDSPELVKCLMVAGYRPARDNLRIAIQRQYKPQVIRILLTDLSLLVEAGKELEDAIAAIPQGSELGKLLREKNQLRLAIQAIPQISY